MKTPPSDIAFTPTVKAIQQRLGSRESYQRMEQGNGWQTRVTPELAAFIAERDTFFLGTASLDGQPYIQHRGGPPGFLKVIDEQTLAFADFRGNRQFLSMGNLQDNDQAFIFLIDFANRRRIKIWGRAKVVEDDARLLDTLSDPDYKARPERVILFQIKTWDINCPQHIKRRYTVEEFAAIEP
jgi:predicted pyridoxine 5'-phosphate oxidase superfamily flavin-nucleotide-binding protein